jgi:hypothetical protein
MTSQRDLDLDRMLDAWFADGPVEAPDRALDAVAVRLRRQRQRPAWLLNRRVPAVSTPIRLLALAAVLVGALAVGSVILTGGAAPAPAPSPAPTPVAATPSPTVAASPIPFPGRTGSLDAGVYSAIVASGTLTFTLPAGWASEGRIANAFSMTAPGSAPDDIINVNGDQRRAALDKDCTEAPEPGVGSTAADLLASFQADDQLAVSDPVAVSLPGMTGVWVDIRLADGATRTCPFSNGGVSVPLVVDTVAGEGPFWGVGKGEIERLYLLDAATGHNIVMIVDSAKGATFDALTAAAQPVFDSMVFTGR